MADGAAVEYLEAPDRLPVPDASFDVVACQQGLQFFPDRPAALAEMRRPLRTGGRIGVAVWKRIEESPPFAVLAEAIRQVAGDTLADRYAGGPWGLPRGPWATRGWPGMRIAVYGAGGVGGYFGGRLAQSGADVHFIARGAHLQALREHGLTVRSVKGDFQVRAPATDDPADVGPCDFVLFCVKTFDTDAAAARLGPLVGEGTAVLSLQNGVENEDKLARAVGDDHVMGGAAFIFAEIAEPGVIVHTGGPTSITFGELDGHASQRAQRLLALCEHAGFGAELSASITTVLWAKLAFICAQAGMTAAVRLPIGEIRTADAAWTAFGRLVAEVCAVAEADGNPVPQAAQDRALALAQAAEPGSFSSLHDDLVAGRRMELEALHGFVVRRAAQHGLAVPLSEAVYAILQPWAIRNQHAST